MSEEWLERVSLALTTVTKAKQVMFEKNLRQADWPCPRCGGVIHLALLGRRQHVRAACETPGCIRVIE